MEPHAILENLLEQLRGAWRHRWLALGVAWIICAVGWTWIFLIPDVYQASATVLVDSRTTLNEVTRGITLESGFEGQIERVSQALLAPPQLQQVADSLGLMRNAHTPLEKQLALQKLRQHIDISGSAGSQSSGGRLVIAYSDHSRPVALKVVGNLLNNFLEGTFGGKKEGSEQAQKFLSEQIADYAKRLSAAEERLAAFKKENFGLMPGAQGDYFTRIQKDTDDLQQAQNTLNVALHRRAELERQLHSEQPLEANAKSSGPADSQPGPSGLALGGSTAARIRETQQRLDELLLRFTDKYPDVIALKATLADLQLRQQSEINAARRGDAGAMAASGLALSPVYQTILQQANQTDVDIAATRAEVADHQQQIEKLKALVNTAPEVEAKLSSLNRDYDVMRGQYQALLERLERARLGEDADANGIVRFQIISPPMSSLVPVAPKRIPLILEVLFVGICAGGGLAHLLNLLRPVYSTTSQLYNTTGVPVLGAISLTWPDKYRQRRRQSLWRYSAVVTCLVLVTGVVVVTQSRISRVVQGSSYESR